MPLSMEEEKKFKSWYKGISQKTGLNPDPDAPQHFYDYRAAWKSGITGPDKFGHWPSEFKHAGHPRMVVEGINTKTGERAMPRTIEELFTELETPQEEPKQPYKPTQKGEESIFAAPEKTLLDYILPFLPFYQQATGEVPWQSPETAMEAISWGLGPLMRGRGMTRAAAPKGATSIREALMGIGSRLFGKPGVPFKMPSGPLPMPSAGRFTHKPGFAPVARGIERALPGPSTMQPSRALEGLSEPILRIPKFAETSATRMKPKFTQTGLRGAVKVGEMLPERGIRMRDFGTTYVERAQAAIEDMLRASLKAKGLIE